MNTGQILLPMLGLMVLTAVVWFVLYARRIPAMRRLGKPAQTYTTCLLYTSDAADDDTIV